MTYDVVEVLCIYEQESYCTLDKININVYGMCDDCIMVNIDRDILEKTKNESQSKTKADINLDKKI